MTPQQGSRLGGTRISITMSHSLNDYADKVTVSVGGKSAAFLAKSTPYVANLCMVYVCTVKNVVYRNAPGEQYFHVSMVTHTVTTETGNIAPLIEPWGVQLHHIFYNVCTYMHTYSSVITFIQLQVIEIPPCSHYGLLSTPSL